MNNFQNSNIILSQKTVQGLQQIPVYYPDDRIAPYLNLNFNEEINKLSNEISGINLGRIKFDKTDIYLIGTLGILDVAISILFNNAGNLNNNISEGFSSHLQKVQDKISISQSSLSFDIINKIQDNSKDFFKDKSINLGEELLKIPTVLSKWGELGIDNIPFKNVLGDLSPFLIGLGNETIAAFFLIYAFSAFIKLFGTTIPGVPTIIPQVIQNSAGFINHILDEAKVFVANGNFSFTTLMKDGLEVATIELAVRIYMHFRYRNSIYSKEMITEKRNKILLISYSLSGAIGAGKFVITGDPMSINPIAILRGVKVAWDVLKHDRAYNKQMQRKILLSTLKNKYELLETLVLLDSYIYYTHHLNELNMKTLRDIAERENATTKRRIEDEKEFNSMLDHLKKPNQC